MAFCSLPHGILKGAELLVYSQTQKRQMAWLKGMKGGTDEGIIKIGFGTTTLRLDSGPKHD